MKDKSVLQNTHSILDILKYMPHRYPFLLVDRVLDVLNNNKIITLKNVTMNEPHFQGHFPEYPVMPGVLIIEAMAQSAGILSVITDGRKEHELCFFASIDRAKFKKQVIPGDTILFEVELKRLTRGIGKYEAIAKVNEIVVAEAEIMIAKRVVKYDN